MVREEKSEPKSTQTQRPTEEQRCRWLRHVDWRFLIDDGALGRVVTTASGDLWHALNLVAADVSRPGAARSDFDTAIAVDPTPQDLNTLRLELRPGGKLVVEWHTARLFGQPARLKTVATAGFADARSYWTWPPIRQENPRVWLPIDAPNAVRYYLASRRTEARSQAAWQIAWMLLWKLGCLADVCVLAKARGSSDGTPVATPKILLTRGAAASNKVVALEFTRSSKQPHTATKHARVPDSIPGLINEATVLSALNNKKPPLQGIPRVLAFEQSAATASVTETALTGVALEPTLIRRRFLSITQAATDWLIELAQRSWSAHSPAHQERHIVDAVAAFHRVFSDQMSDSLTDATQQRLKILGALPVVVEQRDFSPWNVLLNPQGGLTVFDWESAILRGFPGLDLVYFLTHLALFRLNAMDHRLSLAAYVDAWDSRSSIGGVLHESLHRYNAGIGIELDWDALRLLTWVIHAPVEQIRRGQTSQAGEGHLIRFCRFEKARLNEQLTGGASARAT